MSPPFLRPADESLSRAGTLMLISRETANAVTADGDVVGADSVGAITTLSKIRGIVCPTPYN